MKASSMQNHFDVTRSKCRQTKPIVWATLLILMSRHADRSSSSLYLADLRSMQYGCKFATVCVRKGYSLHLYVLSNGAKNGQKPLQLRTYQAITAKRKQRQGFVKLIPVEEFPL